MPRASAAFCSDCGALSEFVQLRASVYGGDDVCRECEERRRREAARRGLAAVACDPTSLALYLSGRDP